jgi:hypothetical protein
VWKLGGGRGGGGVERAGGERKPTTTHSKNRNITLGCAFVAKFLKIFTSLHQIGVKGGWMQALWWIFPTCNIIFCFFVK